MMGQDPPRIARGFNPSERKVSKLLKLPAISQIRTSKLPYDFPFSYDSFWIIAQLESSVIGKHY